MEQGTLRVPWATAHGVSLLSARAQPFLQVNLREGELGGRPEPVSQGNVHLERSWLEYQGVCCPRALVRLIEQPGDVGHAKLGVARGLGQRQGPRATIGAAQFLRSEA